MTFHNAKSHVCNSKISLFPMLILNFCINLSCAFIVCLLYYVIKVCAASKFAGVSLEFVKESRLPKETNLCLMFGSKNPEKKAVPLA